LTRIKDILKQIENLRKQIKEDFCTIRIHYFAKLVDELGYKSSQKLNTLVNHDTLVEEVIEYYKRALKENPKDAVILNNIGVFLCNKGKANQARNYFVQAIKTYSNDRNFHENLYIADILTKTESNHKIPAGLIGNKNSLIAYFDPHGM
jgi:tetratricopeptide (TPR) repeat protein